MKNFRNYEYQQEKQAKIMTSINELTLIETVERIKDEVAILTSRFIEGEFDKEMQLAKLSTLNQLSNERNNMQANFEKFDRKMRKSKAFLLIDDENDKNNHARHAFSKQDHRM